MAGLTYFDEQMEARISYTPMNKLYEVGTSRYVTFVVSRGRFPR